MPLLCGQLVATTDRSAVLLPAIKHGAKVAFGPISQDAVLLLTLPQLRKWSAHARVSVPTHLSEAPDQRSQAPLGMVGGCKHTQTLGSEGDTMPYGIPERAPQPDLPKEISSMRGSGWPPSLSRSRFGLARGTTWCCCARRTRPKMSLSSRRLLPRPQTVHAFARRRRKLLYPRPLPSQEASRGRRCVPGGGSGYCGKWCRQEHLAV
ncbi:hypothetical protein GGS23DRAFT_80987 [Durotheca rogersii]|uniref:uncharacterized protein n=1 Tax=Durotheca rogersii TaxID=419775 RepID=UPI00221FC0F0|nr:uncharacterized protein GGS23DRAFT_80987 [Durotheca rogersii]KAI5862541.1 hypothetical protein GGS23DRAFT_80987 [Durotheca rogersii]